MKLVSAGAARTVTGSCHAVEIGDRKVLIDCGLFQGPEELEALNAESFPFSVEEIDAVLLTHGHLDHVGRLPRLVRQGYRGPIHCTGATRSIAKIILEDSAGLQEEDYRRARRKADAPDTVPPPLYTEADVDKTLGLIERTVDFEEDLPLGDGLVARFHPAGHVLGSAFIELEGPDGRLVASGDLGNRESGVQADFALPPECDVVLVETTYADRTHRPMGDTLAEFRQVIRDAVGRGGNVMIPSFALERTQNVLYYLNRMMDSGEIPEQPVFLDSPMATRMTRLYQTRSNEFLPELADALERGDDPFEPPTLRYTIGSAESKKINSIRHGAIIIAGSGMMTGGRIVHHLIHNLHRREASLVVVGYQARGTLGRRIVDGARSVRLWGRDVEVNAAVHTINGFSAHADQDDLLAWLEGTGKARAMLVHGEPEVMESFRGVLAGRGREATIVERDRAYTL